LNRIDHGRHAKIDNAGREGLGLDPIHPIDGKEYTTMQDRDLGKLDSHTLWKQNWPTGIPSCTSFPYGKITIGEYLRKQAEIMPDGVAINFYGKEMTWKYWDDAADRLANALSDLGYKKGDSILIYMYNSPQICIAYIAAVRLGLIIFMADPGFKEFELQYELQDSGATLVFAFDLNYEYVQAIREGSSIKDVIVTSFEDYMPEAPTLPLPSVMETKKRTFPDSLEFVDLLRKYAPTPPQVDIHMDEEELVLYTGGTTGPPKGCVHSHENTLRSGAFSYQCSGVGFDLSPCDRVLIFTPLSHIGGLSYGLFPACVHGRTLIMLARYDASTVLKAIDKYKPSWVPGTVQVYRDLMDHEHFSKHDVSHVKLWAPGEWMIWVTPEFASIAKEVVGLPVVKWGYGMSEVCNVGPVGTRVGFEIPLKDQFLMGTIPPDEGIDLKIVDFETREELQFGNKGEIVIKSPSRCTYYWNKPVETEKNLTHDGWFFTGDIGMLDEDGYVYWYGRQKYLIRVSGFQVSAGEVEMIGRKCPEIANIAVVGKPHPHKGEIPKAFVQLVAESRSTAEDIESWFKDHIATYKAPMVEVMDQLPLTPKGSVDMKKLLSIGS
jgi:long-chain acyl-CoA synthetase